LYGATGAMKVWSALFSKLPTTPLTVSSKGIEWAWLDASDYATTEEGCPGARRAAFVAGFQPPDHKSCQDSSWLDWFHMGGNGNSNSSDQPAPDQDPSSGQALPSDQAPAPAQEPQQ
jgi:penicillin-binding protein 1B